MKKLVVSLVALVVLGVFLAGAYAESVTYTNELGQVVTGTVGETGSGTSNTNDWPENPGIVEAGTSVVNGDFTSRGPGTLLVNSTGALWFATSGGTSSWVRLR